MRFAAIGLDHRHIYELIAGLQEAGMECAGYCPRTSDPRVLAGVRKRFPDITALEREKLLDDASIALVVTAAVPRERAGIAIAAMGRGKDVLVDKPGVTTAGQLAEVERVVTETGRIFSVCFGERLLSPASEEALRIVRAGGIGRVIQTVGLGPHRLNRALRPGWFFEREAYGGILNDIACHQIDSFLTFTSSDDARIVASTVAGFATQSGFEDFGEILLESDRARGYMRVDWFTPDGLPSWGDGRLIILGTEGTIELRRNLDIAGREGGEHLFVFDGMSTRHIGCEGRPIGYFRSLAADIASRGETAMTQLHVFTVCRLALQAQAEARRFMPGG